MTTTFRPATPDDVEFLGWAMLMAARGHLSRGWFDIVLQRPENFCIEFGAKLANAQAKSWWHHSFFTIAEVDGEVAAAACIFPDEAPYMVSGQAMAEAARLTGIGGAEQAQLWPRGAFILTATSGEEALEQSNGFKTEIHLLLSDFQMKGITGIDLANQLTAQRPNIKVLLMSGYSGGMLVLNEGWHFLPKPFIPSQLRTLVAGLISPAKSRFDVA